MANQNVPKAIIDKFEAALILEGKQTSCVQPSNGHSFALGYILSMVSNGSFNEDEIAYRMTTFKGAK